MFGCSASARCWGWGMAMGSVWGPKALKVRFAGYSCVQLCRVRTYLLRDATQMCTADGAKSGALTQGHATSFTT